ncbi:hypothetical protein Hypma_010804 [Hypsizygus marmoreus]|uniref:Uncharacterized protein n=1 Tax=Hypsizygus marmoreus TaxID=39966 RepID=A0A369JKI9_HYPMA|nr:hypothetical protein Hypma_010804 [Hypsizygus marmoreus]
MFLDSFRGHPALSSLVDFHIVGHVAIHLQPIETKKSIPEVMQALFSFRSLQYPDVRVSAITSFLDDEWLRMAAMHWPDLRMLKVLAYGTPHMISDQVSYRDRQHEDYGHGDVGLGGRESGCCIPLHLPHVPKTPQDNQLSTLGGYERWRKSCELLQESAECTNWEPDGHWEI